MPEDREGSALPAHPLLMFGYRVFGGTLRSEIELPDLTAATDGVPRWTLRYATSAPAPLVSVLGETEIEKDVRVQLARTRDGLALVYSDTGRFDILDGGRSLVWHPGEDARLENARIDITGRVLSIAIHQNGMLCLHGSAVEMNGGAVAFLAPKFHGKSTLALSLTAAGARLLTDDALPVELSSPPRAWPGVHAVRLWDDSARRFMEQPPELPRGTKHLVKAQPDDRVDHPLPLVTIYILVVAAAGVEPPVMRERLPAVPAALSLVAHEKGGAVMSGAMSHEVLDRCARVADEVPVYVLRVVRDYGRLGDVVEQLMDWHAASVPARRSKA